MKMRQRIGLAALVFAMGGILSATDTVHFYGYGVAAGVAAWLFILE
jgi:hypothetical protein